MTQENQKSCCEMCNHKQIGNLVFNCECQCHQNSQPEKNYKYRDYNKKESPQEPAWEEELSIEISPFVEGNLYFNGQEKLKEKKGLLISLKQFQGLIEFIHKVESDAIERERERIVEIIEGMKKSNEGGRIEYANCSCKWCGIGEAEFHKNYCIVLKNNIFNRAIDEILNKIKG